MLTKTGNIVNTLAFEIPHITNPWSGCFPMKIFTREHFSPNFDISPRMQKEWKLIGINLEGVSSNDLNLPITSELIISSNIVVDWSLNSQSTDVILVPEKFSFDNAYPNPFNPVTSIPFALPENAFVKIDIYDLRGSHVEEIVNNQFDAGFHNVNWAPKNISSGVYFIQLQANGNTGKQKVVFIK